MIHVRSNKVPSDIADHNAWNDCWYEESRKALLLLINILQNQLMLKLEKFKFNMIRK